MQVTDLVPEPNHHLLEKGDVGPALGVPIQRGSEVIWFSSCFPAGAQVADFEAGAFDIDFKETSCALSLQCGTTESCLQREGRAVIFT